MTRAAALFCVIALAAAPSQQTDQRSAAVRRAKVWAPTDVASRNVKAGPSGPLAFDAGQTVTCDFIDKTHGKGSTPKFHCRLPSGREVKVRYGRTNGEVYAQVAATRLFWALGFPANAMYPVKVVCRGCSADPFNSKPPASGAPPVTFDPATIDEDFPGATIEAKPDQGWSWKELDAIDERSGGATRAEREALRLLAVFVQHSSNKPINQRLICADPPACSTTMMLIADLGKTFGQANSGNNDARAAANFKEWSSQPVWKDSSGCVGDLHWTWSGSMSDPAIGEAGRQMLSTLLNQLTDAQLHDLFEVSRFTTRDPAATVEQWVSAFKQKRAEIAGRKCPD